MAAGSARPVVTLGYLTLRLRSHRRRVALVGSANLNAMHRLKQPILLAAILLAPSKPRRIPQSLLANVAGLPIERELLLGKIVGGPPEQEEDEDKWQEKQQQRIWEGALNLIVMISGQIGEMPTFGSGIVFAREKDRLYIVTANHVVRSGGTEASNLQIRLKPWPDRELKGRLLPQLDRELDLAVLSVDGLAMNGVDVCRLALDRLADPVSVKRGDAVYPVGNPNGVAWGMPVKPDAISDITGEDVVFQSALIARGHSGGGLLTAGGLLVGMIQADEPPYGRALGTRKTLEVLRAWSFPLHLRVPSMTKSIWAYESPEYVPPLFGAILDGNLDETKLLLREACTDVNAELDGNRPLQMAARQGQPELVRLLVEAGADINTGGPCQTPLQNAARSGNAETVKFLIAHGAGVNINAPNCFGALHWAAEEGGLEAVRVLLASGADPNLAGEGNQTPLFRAMLGRYLGGPYQEEARKKGEGSINAARDEILRILIKTGANVNCTTRDGDTPLSRAVEEEDLAAVRILLAAGAKVDVKDRNNLSPIRRVSRVFRTPPASELEEIAALLVQSSSKIEQEDGLRLLQNASEEGWVEVADLLVKHGVNVKGDDGNKALEDASRYGYSEVVKVLLEAGADPNGGGRPTPLVKILGGVDPREMSKMDPAKRLEIVKLLVSKGATVNVYPDVPALSYMEPLYLALIELTPPDLKVAEVLIAHGANVNATSLLDVAMYKHRPEVVEFLRRAEAKPGRFSH